jgi:hypothetical protein
MGTCHCLDHCYTKFSETLILTFLLSLFQFGLKNAVAMVALFWMWPVSIWIWAAVTVYRLCACGTKDKTSGKSGGKESGGRGRSAAKEDASKDDADKIEMVDEEDESKNNKNNKTPTILTDILKRAEKFSLWS